MKPTSLLTEEHRMIKEMLGLIPVINAGLANGGGIPIRHLESVVDFIRTFADRCHHAKEEDLLFAAMAVKGMPREGGPIGVMLREHEIGRKHVRTMEDGIALLRQGDQSGVRQFVAGSTAYAGLLFQHIDKEDNILYPMADQLLSAEEQRQLLVEFERVENERMGQGVHEKYHRLLRQLTEQYGADTVEAGFRPSGAKFSSRSSE